MHWIFNLVNFNWISTYSFVLARTLQNKTIYWIVNVIKLLRLLLYKGKHNTRRDVSENIWVYILVNRGRKKSRQLDWCKSTNNLVYVRINFNKGKCDYTDWWTVNKCNMKHEPIYEIWLFENHVIITQ